MKVVFLAAGGILLALWSATTSTTVLAAQMAIGPNTPVAPGPILVQLGVLFMASVILIRFGMLLREWRSVLTEAARVVKDLADLDERVAQHQRRLDAHDGQIAHQHLLIQSHAARLGLAKDYLDEAAG